MASPVDCARTSSTVESCAPFRRDLCHDPRFQSKQIGAAHEIFGIGLSAGQSELMRKLGRVARNPVIACDQGQTIQAGIDLVHRGDGGLFQKCACAAHPNVIPRNCWIVALAKRRCEKRCGKVTQMKVV